MMMKMLIYIYIYIYICIYINVLIQVHPRLVPVKPRVVNFYVLFHFVVEVL